MERKSRTLGKIINIMSKIESKIGKINQSDEKIYNFISDFNNFKSIIPNDKVTDWESTPDSCTFKVEGIGKAKMKINESEPFKLVKIQGTGNGITKVEFNL